MKLLKKLARAALLVIDDFGVAAVTGKQYRDLLEILDDRHGSGATLITSQFPVDQWHERDQRCHRGRRHPGPLGP